MKLYLKRQSRALHLPRVLKGSAVAAHCKPCALLEGLVGVLLSCVGKTVIRLCRSRWERLLKNCFNMALAITLSELAWIFRRELAIMISLCRLSFCFYFSKKKKKIDFVMKFSWGFCLDLLCPTRLSAIPRLPQESALRALPEMESHINKIAPISILLSWLMSATPKEVAGQLQGELSVPAFPLTQLPLCDCKAACMESLWAGKGVMVSQLGGSSPMKNICLLQTK